MRSERETVSFRVSFTKKKDLREEFQREALSERSYVYRAASYLIKNQADVEDLVQETYLRAFRFFSQFQPRTNCRAWLLTILRHLIINRYRQKERSLEPVNWEQVEETYASMVEEAENLRCGNPECILFFKTLDGELANALRQLPEKLRTATLLVYVDELTYEEAAEVLRCPAGTVRSRLSRARRLLQVSLREYAKEMGLIDRRASRAR